MVNKVVHYCKREIYALAHLNLVHAY